MSLVPFTSRLRGKESLSAAEAQSAFDVIFAGSAGEADIAGFLSALHDKGESVAEMTGAVASMRAKMVAISAPADAMDIVGTGGDGRGTLNISTAAAVVVAGCGVPVAKHGNRASTGKAGSSDVLAALGIGLEPPLPVLEQCLAEAGLCFLFAPRHHPAMRHVADIRRKMATRTVFNLLGPLTNPANVKRHLIGVYAPEWLRPVADVLRGLGSASAWVTHGRDGMDEVTSMGLTDVVRLNGETLVLSPNELGIKPPQPAALQGSDAAENAAALRRLLAGDKGAYRDIVLLNAGAALVVAEKAVDMAQGMKLAADSLDSGAARGCLERVITLTNGSVR